jgi:hypothetical protein
MSRFLPALFVVLGLCGLASGPALGQASDVVSARANAELRAAPEFTAPLVQTLAAQQALNRLERRGPWVRVNLANNTAVTGWVHMFQLGAEAGPVSASTAGNSQAGAGAGAGAAATGALRAITGLFGGANTQRQTTAATTAGIRGLGAEDIANAQPNPQAVQQMEALRLPAPEAQSFARAAGLQPQQVDELPVPPPPAAAANQPGSSAMPGNN